MSCCTPGPSGHKVGSDDDASVLPAVPQFASSGSRPDVVALQGGDFAMGDDGPLSYPQDGEGPVRRVTVEAFGLDRCAVTTAEFAAFVDATGYRTDAERHGFSFVFAGLLPDDFPPTRGVAAAPWWREVPGASWAQPEGPASDASDRLRHPVVHVSWNDARAFASWAGGRLPTEPEWEYAARAGSSSTYPWGEELVPDGVHMANIWQGSFPDDNSCDDGYYGTAPVETFPANAFWLHNMIGNVWEWTLDPFEQSLAVIDSSTARTMKGGSFMCHASYCARYRPAARIAAAPDSSASNVGFRCAT